MCRVERPDELLDGGLVNTIGKVDAFAGAILIQGRRREHLWGMTVIAEGMCELPPEFQR